MRMQVIAGETIFAASTAPGRSAIAVIRVSGPGALEAVFRTCGVRPLPRVATLSSFKDPVDGQLIDRILVLWFPGPRSFTGDDCAEFHVHGGRAVLRAVLRVLGEVPNFRLARAGEFTRRGFVNGKLDLVEVDGLADVIAADTEMQLRQAQAVAGGHLSSRVSSWRSNLISAQALLEANIDFSDEADVPSQFDSEVISLVKCVLDEMRLLLAEFKRGEIVREGFVVVIVGAPNSGKSSLLNAIARRDVAIVSAEPGTTRDLIEVSVDLDGIAVVLVDTAGLREIAAGVESEGIRRARLRAVTADLALWVSDHENPSFAPEGLIDSGQVLSVRSKSDLCPEVMESADIVSVSSVTGFGIADLMGRIRSVAEGAVRGARPALLAQERHRSQVAQAVAELERLPAHRRSVELMAEDLRRACWSLESMIGKVGAESVLGEIFSRFCIGK